MRRTRRPRFVLMNKMDDLNLHYRFLNWRRRIREIREVRAFRYQERFKHILVDGDTLRLYNGRAKGRQFGSKCNSGDRIGCGIEPVSFDVQTAQIFFTKNGKRVGSTIMPMSPDGLFPAVGMHSLGEEVRLHLNAELGREDDSVMMVDSYEDEWGRLHDVRVCGTLLEYLGKGKSIVDVGLAQARHPLSTRSHYFEVEIVDPGEKCYIALGLARKDYPKNRHPGWSRGSVAYHADDGKIFHGSGVGDPFGPRCYKGDIMGCGIMFPRDYILDSEGFLHSEWQDHWEEGCSCTFWGLLPYHWNAELWRESQSGSASLEWLGASPLDLPLFPLLTLAEPGTHFLTSLRICLPGRPWGGGGIVTLPLPDQVPAKLVCAHVSDLVQPLLSVPGPEFLVGQDQAQRMVLLSGGSHCFGQWAPTFTFAHWPM
ncbi:SPRY domain-containing protein 3 isoform X3 [Manis javanica]|uniref:SPRY domain-containing protein 3 isoform X3 n=1 Tax=Manis javanica TaxID=9974 RepID=UPI003C6D816F